MSIEEVPGLVRELYRLVGRLESMFPGRPFTPDGHLVGSLGEVLAAHRYGLTLLDPSAPVHDAKAADGREVQVKITQGKKVGIRAEPEHLIVLSLHKDGAVSEVFNGPGKLAWDAAGKLQKSNGQRPIGLGKLRSLQQAVAEELQVPQAQQVSGSP